MQYVPRQPRFQLGLEKELDSEPEGTRTPQEGATDGNGCADPWSPNARSTSITGTSKKAPRLLPGTVPAAVPGGSGTRMGKGRFGFQRGHDPLDINPSGLFRLSANQERARTAVYNRSVLLGRWNPIDVK